MTNEQLTALGRLFIAIIEAVESAGPDGAPGGTIYAALSTFGVSLTTYEALMNALVVRGKLTKRGHFYFIPSKAAQ
jgi:hypothetical protein